MTNPLIVIQKNTRLVCLDGFYGYDADQNPDFIETGTVGKVTGIRETEAGPLYDVRFGQLEATLTLRQIDDPSAFLVQPLSVEEALERLPEGYTVKMMSGAVSRCYVYPPEKNPDISVDWVSYADSTESLADAVARAAEALNRKLERQAAPAMGLDMPR